ncbi:CGNR zinc finger domain-containing protein [Paraburkholderia xenovorans]|uniref:CGNR zinc finger domain-containing protein n=1 Tax=Paraburkholderia xenovorans TaxID=36873 RepID=UPI002ADDFF41|nr:CGNR zinc finger domain-containing protein [Paraburkholderia xenovorans]
MSGRPANGGRSWCLAAHLRRYGRKPRLPNATRWLPRRVHCAGGPGICPEEERTRAGRMRSARSRTSQSVARTRGHARRWCSMAICANRAKIAAHRKRLREQKNV